MDNAGGLIPVITRLFSEQLHIDVPTPDTDLLESGMMDSFAFVNLLVMMESELRINVSLDDPDLELSDLSSVRQIARYAESLRRSVDAGVP